jgi:hypothetical protein
MQKNIAMQAWHVPCIQSTAYWKRRSIKGKSEYAILLHDRQHAINSALQTSDVIMCHYDMA